MINLITELRSLLKFLLIFGIKRCCVCGKISKYRHMSIMGQIPFYVCKKHYKETGPAFGIDKNAKDEMNPSGRRMGLRDKNGKWVLLEYYNK